MAGMSKGIDVQLADREDAAEEDDGRLAILIPGLPDDDLGVPMAFALVELVDQAPNL